jgi:hypothetical protein
MPSSKQVLFSWHAPARPFKRRSRDFYVNLMAMAFLIGIVLFIIEGFMPILLMISLLFLFYIMSTIEPDKMEYEITSNGINFGNLETPWNQLGRFWFTYRFGSEVLVIETASLLGRTEIVINPDDKNKIKDILSKYLVFEKIPPSTMDKMVNRASRFMPKS